MKSYIIQDDTVLFRQGTLPKQWMTGFAQLGIFVTVTGSKRYPYSVIMTESDFLDAIELAKGL